MYRKFLESFSWLLISLLIAVWLARPYWEASEIATSKSGYLIWVLSGSIGSIFLIGTTFSLWIFIRRYRTTMFLVGGIAVLCGIGLWYSSTAMLERAAPGLYKVEKASGVDTTIHDWFTTTSGRYNTAVAATVTLKDGATVQALTFYRYDRRYPPYELYRDLGGTYWVGDPTRDATKAQGFTYIFGGILMMCLALLCLIGPVRRFVSNYIYDGD